ESREGADVDRFGDAVAWDQQPLDGGDVRQREADRGAEQRPCQLAVRKAPRIVPDKRGGGAGGGAGGQAGGVRFGVNAARADDHWHDLAGRAALGGLDRGANFFLLLLGEVFVGIHVTSFRRRRRRRSLLLRR